MKKKILEMVGAKSEEDFYNNFFPNTPEGHKAFMAKYGKKVEKLQRGNNLKKAVNGNLMGEEPWRQGTSQYYLTDPETGQQISHARGNVEQIPMMQMQSRGATLPVPPLDNNLKIPGQKPASNFDAGKAMGVASGIVGGLVNLGEERKQQWEAEKWAKVAKVQKEAADSFDLAEKPKRKYATEEDKLVTGEAFFPTMGTNQYAGPFSRNGKLVNKVKGKKGEIQNTYDPDTLYTDLGYAFGGMSVPGIQGGGMDGAYKAVGSVFNNNAGTQIGGGIGQIFGPAAGIMGTMIGGGLDEAFGPAGKLKHAQNEYDSYSNQILAKRGIRGIQSQFGGSMENGGWISNDWQPQVIAKFGQHNLSDLLKDDPTMATLRTGGHIRENYTYPEDKFAFGGELEVDGDSGRLEHLSYNPYNSGENKNTYMLRGKTHEQGGIPTRYGDNIIEAETNEPLNEVHTPGEGDSMLVYGKLDASSLDDPAAKGKTMKRYVDMIAKDEKKHNDRIEKSLANLELIEEDGGVRDSFTRLKQNSFRAMMEGSDKYLQIDAAKKDAAATRQETFNTLAKKFGVKAEPLSKGKVVKETDPRMLMGKDGIDVNKMPLTEAPSDPSGWAERLAKQYAPKLAEYNALLQAMTGTNPLGVAEQISEFTPFPPLVRALTGNDPTGTELMSIVGAPVTRAAHLVEEAGQAIVKRGRKPAQKLGSKLFGELSAEEKLWQDDMIDTVADELYGVEKRLPGEEVIPISGKRAEKKVLTTKPAEAAKPVPFEESSIWPTLALATGVTGIAGITAASLGDRNIQPLPPVAPPKPIVPKPGKKVVNPYRSYMKKGEFGIDVPPKVPTAIDLAFGPAEEEEEGFVGGYLARPGEETPPPMAKPVQKKAVNTMNAAPKTTYISPYGIVPWSGNRGGTDKRTASEFTAQEWDNIAKTLGFTGYGNKAFQEFLLNNPQVRPLIENRHRSLYGTGAFLDPEHFGAGWAVPELKTIDPNDKGGIRKDPNDPFGNLLETVTVTSDRYKEPTKEDENVPLKGFTANDLLNQLLPYLRPSDRERLDPRQLAGEMYALSSNVEEPVPMERFTPQLTVPYKISLRDILNENIAASRAAQRSAGYNPAAQAQIAAQQYMANEKVLGEQFRMNQEMANKTYAQNRQILDAANLQNLGAAERQSEKQAAAKAATKATTLASLNSISDKEAKNLLEGRTLATYENLYGYRFGKDMRAKNWNGIQEFNFSEVGNANSGLSEYERAQAVVAAYKAKEKEKIKEASQTARNGAIVKAVNLKKI